MILTELYITILYFSMSAAIDINASNGPVHLSMLFYDYVVI